MTGVDSAWDRFPGYRIDLLPWRGIGRVRLGEFVLGESDACLLVSESDHEPQLYFPESCVAWECLTSSCPMERCRALKAGSQKCLVLKSVCVR